MAKDDDRDAASSDSPADASVVADATPRKRDAKASKRDAKAKKAGGKTGKADGKARRSSGRAAATADASPGQDGISIAGHARASAGVRRAKGWGGLAGFVIAGLLSMKASVPVATTFERALIFGVIGYVVAWGASIFIWRQLIVAEQRAVLAELERRLLERTQPPAPERPARRAGSATPGARS